MPPWLESGRTRSVEWDWRCARALHRGAAHPVVHRVFALASRLGDAPLWVIVTGVLLLVGDAAQRRVGLAALALGAINLAIYWSVKKLTRRERPFRQCTDIRECVPAADPFSFPSGHAMHAVAYAVLFGAQLPWLAPLLGYFALLVALSRVVLGVHFPSDVLAGAAIGATSAAVMVGMLA